MSSLLYLLLSPVSSFAAWSTTDINNHDYPIHMHQQTWLSNPQTSAIMTIQSDMSSDSSMKLMVFTLSFAAQLFWLSIFFYLIYFLLPSIFPQWLISAFHCFFFIPHKLLLPFPYGFDTFSRLHLSIFFLSPSFSHSQKKIFID